MKTTNPVTEETIATYQPHSSDDVNTIIDSCSKSQSKWKSIALDSRLEPVKKLSSLLSDPTQYASLITQEMGKPLKESKAEVEKCALLCDYYLKNAQSFLADKAIEGPPGRNLIVYQPIGVILGIMPWNFPFWQVFRFAVPALIAGNGAILKHASNVTGCSLAIEKLFADAGFPEHLFRSILVEGPDTEAAIEHPAVKAVSLTGSEKAGMAVASKAGSLIKKCVLELGGSDPFIVLADTNLDEAIKTAVKARLMNCGQSCIAAKRFIIEAPIYEAFIEGLEKELSSNELGPLAREDLRTAIHQQVTQSIQEGALCVCGGEVPEGKGYFYPATVLRDVRPMMTAFKEETFGPLFAVMKVSGVEEAIQVANDSPYGLGGAVWTQDLKKGESIARQIETGTMVVNGMTASHPALPFGGVKLSGYGRELSKEGIREFTNVKTLCIR